MRIWLILTTACLVTAFGVSHAEPLQVGDRAPNWMLMDQFDQPISLYNTVDSGHMVVMVFWASWCGHCKQLLPEIKRVSAAQKERKVTFYLMNVWENGDPAAFSEQHAQGLPVILRADSVARRFAVDVTPAVVVVGPDRRILYKQTSAHNIKEVSQAIQKTLGKL